MKNNEVTVHSHTRRPISCLPIFLSLFLAWAACGAASDSLDPTRAKPSDDGKLLFYNAVQLDREGQGFSDVKASYDRLPARAEGKVRPAV